MSLPPFEEAVRKHGAAVLRVCRAVAGPDDAEDAWSDTFLAALRAYPALPAQSNVAAWLMTIAHRKAIDHYRARRRRPVPVGAIPEQTAALDGGGNHDVLRQQLAELSERQRDSVIYHHLGGLPFREVAALLGGTEAAVRRAAADGIKKLRALNCIQETLR